jgi:class 3 adenylate cyclase
MARYEEILKEVLKAHRGYLFKTVGKAFCCAFAVATEVLEVALPSGASGRGAQNTCWTLTL